MRFGFRFIVGLLWVCAATAASAGEAVPPAAGRIAINMSIDAVKKAAPEAVWTDIASERTGKIVGVHAKSAWELEGHAYGIGLEPRAYGAAILSVVGKHKVADVAACRARVLALAAHFETFFDKLTPDRSPLAFAYPQSRFEVLVAGKRSQIRETRVTDETTLWEFAQAKSDAYPYSIRAEARFKEGEASEDAQTCDIFAKLASHPAARPAFEMLDAKVKPTTLPSAAAIHDSIDGLLLPASGVSLTLTCGIDRAAGTLWGCSTGAGDREKTAEERAAQRRLYAYRYDPKRLDPDNDVPLRTTITIKLAPKDRDSKRSAAAPAEPIWFESASAGELNRHYPVRALAKGLQARVRATCQIKDDLSVDCATIETDPPGLVEFEAAARKILTLYRAAPLLRNAKPAAGTTAIIPIVFTIN